MDMLELVRSPRGQIQRRRATRKPHEYLTHDQRKGDVRELEFEDLSERERAIFLRCGFRPPQAA